nr:hypothetical protein GCM10020093_055360 [Planobispora longispora]
MRSRAEAAEEEIGRLARSLAAAEQRAGRAEAEHAAQELAEPDGDPVLAEELEIALAAVDSARQAVEAAKAVVEEAKGAVAGPNAALGAARAALSAARAADQKAQRQVAALEARFEALQLGLSRGADGGAALLAADGGTVTGVLGPVAAMMSVRPGAEAAVAAVLGAAAEAVAVESLQSAVDAVEFLRAREGGRADLVISAASPPPRPAPSRSPAPSGRPTW